MVQENERLVDIGDVVSGAHSHPHVDVADEAESRIERKELLVGRAARHDGPPDDRADAAEEMPLEELLSRCERRDIKEENASAVARPHRPACEPTKDETRGRVRVERSFPLLEQGWRVEIPIVEVRDVLARG